MRSIVLAEDLVRNTHGINGSNIVLKSFNMTDKQLTYSIEYLGFTEGKSELFQATLTDNAVKPKFELNKNEEVFIKEQISRAFYIRGELFEDEKDENGDLFEGIEYDPARGYVNKEND